MPVFSLIRRGRAQAKEHNAKQADKEKEEAVKLPYRHVVTHAAADALSGVPSSWKHVDRPRIMEQHKRRTAMVDNETNMAGMPRVGSSLSYVSYASVYATPVVPLPRNYSHNNISSSWQDQLATFKGGIRSTPQSGSIGSSKGKEREFIQPSSSTDQIPRLYPGQPSTISSKGISSNRSSANLSSSDDGLETRNKAVGYRFQRAGYQPNPSRNSTSSSEKSYRIPPNNLGTAVEAPAKNDRYYPPLAQSSYFSAPRPVARRTSDTGAFPPYIPSAADQSDSATSSINSSQFSSISSIASIGVAIAPPRPPITPPSEVPSEESATEQENDEATIAITDSLTVETPVETPQRLSNGQHRLLPDIITVKPNGQVIGTAAKSPQKARRRLSKSRPPSIDDNGVRISTETIDPTGQDSIFTAITTDEYVQLKYPVQQHTEEIIPTPTIEPVQRQAKKLSKNPKGKNSNKKGWSFRFGSRIPVVAAH